MTLPAVIKNCLRDACLPWVDRITNFGIARFRQICGGPRLACCGLGFVTYSSGRCHVEDSHPPSPSAIGAASSPPMLPSRQDMPPGHFPPCWSRDLTRSALAAVLAAVFSIEPREEARHAGRRPARAAARGRNALRHFVAPLLRVRRSTRQPARKRHQVSPR